MRRLARIVLAVAALALALGAAVPALAAAAPYADTVGATTGLAAYWRLGEAAGPVAADAKAAWPGTISGVTLGTLGALTDDADTAATFAGAGSVNAGNGPVLTGHITVEAWVSVDTIRSGYLVS